MVQSPSLYPYELWIKIYLYCNLETLVMLSRTCPYLSLLCRDDNICKKFFNIENLKIAACKCLKFNKKLFRVYNGAIYIRIDRINILVNACFNIFPQDLKMVKIKKYNEIETYYYIKEDKFKLVSDKYAAIIIENRHELGENLELDRIIGGQVLYLQRANELYNTYQYNNGGKILITFNFYQPNQIKNHKKTKKRLGYNKLSVSTVAAAYGKPTTDCRISVSTMASACRY